MFGIWLNAAILTASLFGMWWDRNDQNIAILWIFPACGASFALSMCLQ